VRRGAVAIALVAVVAVGWWLWLRPPPYQELRQASIQTIPGTLGYALRPPPDGLDPRLTPDEVRRRFPAGGGEVQVGLGSVLDTYEDRVLGSGWVLVARGVCLRNQKGELVSDARSAGAALDCTDATIWLLGVDATSGEPFVGLAGHDEQRSWRMDLDG
jgi:hypothetical protein